MAYDGFISYSHAADAELAVALQRGLQRFAKPWWKLRELKVFRDESALSANPDLWGSIESELDDSRWLIVLCSPRAAVSQWVDREVAHFVERTGVDRILPVVTDGEWAWDSTVGVLSADTDCAPPSMRAALDSEPRHIDMRWYRSEASVDARDERLRSALADLAAPMHGRGKDELIGEDVRTHRRNIRMATLGVIALALVTVVAVIAAVAAFSSSRQARDNERRADASRLAAQSGVEMDSGYPARSLLLAVEAADNGGPDSTAARNALLSAIGRLGNLHSIITDPAIEPGTSGRANFIAVSGDGSAMAVGGREPAVQVVDGESWEPIEVTGEVALSLDWMSDSVLVATSLTQPEANTALPDDPSHVEVFDAGTGEALWRSNDPAARVVAVGEGWAVVSDGADLVTVDPQGTPTATWTGESAHHERFQSEFAQPQWAGVAVDWPAGVSGDGTRVVGRESSDGDWVMWDAGTGAVLARVGSAGAPPPGFDPTGQRLVAAAHDGVSVFDLSGSVLAEADFGEQALEARSAVAFAASDGGESVAVLGRSGGVRVVRPFAEPTVVQEAVLTAEAGTGPASGGAPFGSAVGGTSMAGNQAVFGVSPEQNLPDAEGRAVHLVDLDTAAAVGPLHGVPIEFNDYSSPDLPSDANGTDAISSDETPIDATPIDATPIDSNPTGAPVEVTLYSEGFPPSVGLYGLDGELRESRVDELVGIASDSSGWWTQSADAEGIVERTFRVSGAPPGNPEVVDATRYWNDAALRNGLLVALDSRGRVFRYEVADGAGEAIPLELATPSVVPPSGEWISTLGAVAGATALQVRSAQGELLLEMGAEGVTDLKSSANGSWLVAGDRFGFAPGFLLSIEALQDDEQADDEQPGGGGSTIPTSGASVSMSGDGTRWMEWIERGGGWIVSVHDTDPGGGPDGGSGPVAELDIGDVADGNSVEGSVGPALQGPAGALDTTGERLAVRTPGEVRILDVDTGDHLDSLGMPDGLAGLGVAWGPDGSLVSMDGLAESSVVLRAWDPEGRATGLGVLDEFHDWRIAPGGGTSLLMVTDGTDSWLFDRRTLELLGPAPDGAQSLSADGNTVHGVEAELFEDPNVFEIEVSTAALTERACVVAGRNLTQLEWQRFAVPGEWSATCERYGLRDG